MLTDTQIRGTKPTDRPLKLADEGADCTCALSPTAVGIGVSTIASAASRRRLPWVSIRTSLCPKPTNGFGRRGLLTDGIDPMADRKSTAKTFEVVAREWRRRWADQRHPQYAYYVLKRLEEDVFPSVGSQAPSDIPASAFRDVVKKIEARGALEIAKRVLQNCSQIMRYAVANDYATHNPVADIRPADVLRPRKRRHYPRASGKELPALLRARPARKPDQ